MALDLFGKRSVELRRCARGRAPSALVAALPRCAVSRVSKPADRTRSRASRFGNRRHSRFGNLPTTRRCLAGKFAQLAQTFSHSSTRCRLEIEQPITTAELSLSAYNER